MTPTVGYATNILFQKNSLGEKIVEELHEMTGCTGRQCEYSIEGTNINCQNGSGGCFTAKMLVAKPSDFHDAQLVDASAQINKILDNIKPDPHGRKLSFLATNMGAMLAWVRHDIVPSPGGVTSANSDDEIAEALGVTH